MEKQVSKTLIGGFVIGALVLVVAGIMIFGSGKIFEKKRSYVLNFQESVKGLNVGAPVVFKGVKVGSVTDIQLIADADALTLEIPVIIEVLQDKIQIKKGRRSADVHKDMSRLIERGLRAQLQSQSMVTGQLMVEFDFYPDKPSKLRGVDEKMPEIPTIPSAMENIVQAIKGLKLDQLTQNLTSAVEGLERIMNSPDVTQSLKALHQTINDTRELIANTNSHIDPLADQIEGTIKDAGKLVRHADRQVGLLGADINKTLKDARGLLTHVDGRVDPLSASIQKTADEAGQAFEQAEKTLETMTEVLGKDSPMVYQATRTLKELSGAARSIRVWAEYLERHPEALVRGKK